MLVRYEQLERTVAHLQRRALAPFAVSDTATATATGDATAGVVNLLPYRRRGLVDLAGYEPAVIELDGFSADTVESVPAEPSPARDGTSIESDCIRVDAAPDGTVTLLDKTTGKRFERAPPPRGRARRRRPLQLLPGRRRRARVGRIRVGSGAAGRPDRLGARNPHAHGEHDRAADRGNQAGAVHDDDREPDRGPSTPRGVPDRSRRATSVPRDSSRSSTARSSRPRRRPIGASRPTRRTTRSERSRSDRSRSSRRASRNTRRAPQRPAPSCA